MRHEHVRTFTRIAMTLATVALWALHSGASNSGVTYQGRILKPDMTPLLGSNVQFRLQVRTPGAENCLMFEEIKALDMRNSNGVFALTINDGNGTRTDTSGYSLDRIFANRGVFNFSGVDCTSGTAYTPNSADGRKLQVLFKDETMSTWEPMPAQTINYIPFAFDSKQVQGFGADSLLRVVNGSGDPVTGLAPLSNAEYTKLMSLIAGSSSDYERAGRLGGATMPTTASLTTGQVLSWSGTAWVASTPGGAGSVGTAAIADSAVTAVKLSPAIAGTSGQLLSVDGSGNLVWANAPNTSQWTTNGTMIHYMAGKVGIGTTSPWHKLTTYIAPNAPTSEQIATMTVNNVTGGSADSLRGAYTGVFVADDSATPANYTTSEIRGAAGEVYAGYKIAPNGTGQTSNWNGAVNLAVGQTGYVANLTTGTGHFNQAAGLNAAVQNAGSGAIRDARGLNINSVQATGTDAGAPHNAYGIYIDGVSASGGSTNNSYSIYSNSVAPSYFSGNVGIGTTSPTHNLDVNGVVAARGNALAGLVKIYGNYNGTASTHAYLEYLGSGGSRSGYIGYGSTSTNLMSLVNERNAGIEFQTNALPRMRITEAGDVGIGTSAPNYKLDVAGDINVTGNFKMNGTNISSGMNALTGDVTGSGTGSVATTIANDAITTPKILNSNVTYAKIQNVSATNRLLGRSSTGAGVIEELTVGAGLNLAAGVLTATGSDSFAALPCGNGYVPYRTGGAWTCAEATSAGTVDAIVKRDSSGAFVASGTTLTNSLKLKDGTTGGEVTLASPTGFTSYGLTLPTTAGGSGQVLTSNGSGVLSWTTPAGGSQWTTQAPGINYMGGNVGIGTTSPTSKLQVAGSLQVANNADITWGGTYATGAPAIAAATGTGFYLFPEGNAAGVALAIKAGGNVGIGTTSPSTKLDVVGTMKVSGDVDFTSTTTSAGHWNGAVHIAGGLGVAGPINSGGHLSGTQIKVSGSNGNSYAPTGSTVAPIAFAANGSIQVESDGGTGSGAGLILAGSNSVPTTQAAYIGLSTHASGYTPAIVFGQQTGASAYAERMRIAFDGNVGIGTTAPGKEFDVTGTVRASSTLETGLTGSNGQVLIRNSLNIGSFIAAYAAELRHANAISNAPTTFFMNDGGSVVEKMRISANGNVGIGTTSPSYKLDVNGAINATSLKIAGVDISASPWATQAPGINYMGGNVGIGTTSPTTALDIVGAVTVSAHINASGMMTASKYELASNTTAPVAGMFRTNANTLSLSTASTERLRIDASGNVGIGTTSPLTKLHVVGTGASVLVGTSGGLEGSIALGNGGHGLARNYRSNGNDVGLFTTGGDLHFSANTATNTQMIIKNGGNVGVGTSTPGQKLDVVGSGQFSVSALSPTFTTPTAGGGVYLKGGDDAFGNGGAVTVIGGSSVLGTAGHAWLEGGSSDGGNGSAFVKGGQNFGGNGGHASVSGGNGTMGNASGGNVTLQGGTKTGSGIFGYVNILQNGGEVFRVTDGNVGIGTTAPSEKLEVVGNLKVTGRTTASVTANSDTLTAITANFSAANFIRASGASGACGTLNFTNVAAGGSYTITIPNATATCSTIQMAGSTTNVKTPSGYAGGSAASGLVYTAIYDGTTLWVSYIPF